MNNLIHNALLFLTLRSTFNIINLVIDLGTLVAICVSFYYYNKAMRKAKAQIDSLERNVNTKIVDHNSLRVECRILKDSFNTINQDNEALIEEINHLKEIIESDNKDKLESASATALLISKLSQSKTAIERLEYNRRVIEDRLEKAENAVLEKSPYRILEAVLPNPTDLDLSLLIASIKRRETRIVKPEKKTKTNA